MCGKEAHRVYSTARASGLLRNYGAFGLPTLVFACIDARLLMPAVVICEEARQALQPLDVATTSALVVALAAASMIEQIGHLLTEAKARRVTIDAPSLHAALTALLGATPTPLNDACAAIELLAIATSPAAREKEGPAGTGTPKGVLDKLRGEVPTMLDTIATAMCEQGKEPKAIALVRTLAESAVLPLGATWTRIAAALSRRRAVSPLNDLASLVSSLRRRLPAADYDAAVAACAAAGVSATDADAVELPASSVTPAEPSAAASIGTKRGRLSSGARDAKSERMELQSVQVGESEPVPRGLRSTD